MLLRSFDSYVDKSLILLLGLYDNASFGAKLQVHCSLEGIKKIVRIILMIMQVTTGNVKEKLSDL